MTDPSATSETTNGNDSTIFRKQFSVEENMEILNFFHSKTQDPDCGLVEKFRGVANSKKMWNEYIQQTGSTRPVSTLQSHFYKMMPKLHIFPMEVEMKLDIYYSFDQPVHGDFIPIAHKYAFLMLDDKNRIEMFEMKSEEQMKSESEKTVPKKRKRMSTASDSVNEPPTVRGRFAEEEIVRMWKFVLRKLTDQESGKIEKNEKFKVSSKKLWTEFVEKENGNRSAVSYASQMRKLSIHDAPLDLRTKAGIIYALNIPVTQELLCKLQEKTEVKVDNNECIIEYNSKDLISKPLRLRM